MNEEMILNRNTILLVFLQLWLHTAFFCHSVSDVEDNVEVIDNRQHSFCVGSTDCSEKIKERDDENRLLEIDFHLVLV